MTLSESSSLPVSSVFSVSADIFIYNDLTIEEGWELLKSLWNFLTHNSEYRESKEQNLIVGLDLIGMGRLILSDPHNQLLKTVSHITVDFTPQKSESLDELLNMKNKLKNFLDENKITKYDTHITIRLKDEFFKL